MDEAVGGLRFFFLLPVHFWHEMCSLFFPPHNNMCERESDFLPGHSTNFVLAAGGYIDREYSPRQVCVRERKRRKVGLKTTSRVPSQQVSFCLENFFSSSSCNVWFHFWFVAWRRGSQQPRYTPMKQKDGTIKTEREVLDDRWKVIGKVAYVNIFTVTSTTTTIEGDHFFFLFCLWDLAIEVTRQPGSGSTPESQATSRNGPTSSSSSSLRTLFSSERIYYSSPGIYTHAHRWIGRNRYIISTRPFSVSFPDRIARSVVVQSRYDWNIG